VALMLVTVRDANSLGDINNAGFSGQTVSFTNTGGGSYEVTCNPNSYVNCDASCYAGQTFNSGGLQEHGQLRPRTIGLVRQCWP
jgi:hypothetical protein